MRLRLIRLRLRRRVHFSQKQVEDLSQQAEIQIERHFFRRFYRLQKVRRFVLSWIGLMVIIIGGVATQTYLLGGYFQKLQPVPGGIYNEGVVGTFTTANPLYATNDVDSSVSHLIFASLLKYNDKNQLVGDLASGYQVDAKGTTYTVKLKPNLTWQDGQPLSAQDVAFTYHLIQNPDAQSPLMAAWKGITVKATGSLKLSFHLTDPLASFPNDLTNGIVPQHLLGNIPPSEMRSVTFNTTNPVGSGPFAWQAINVSGNDPTNAQEQIALLPFTNYHGGRPKLREFVVHAYADPNQLIQAFQAGQLTGVEGLSEVPSVHNIKSLQVHNILLSAGVYVFFKTSSGVLADQAVRSALVQSVNNQQLIAGLGYPTHAVNEPLLEGQLAYNPSYKQPSYNLSAAENLLNQDGWTPNKSGLRTKNGQILSFNLTVSNSVEYQQVATELQNYWQKLGVRVQLQIQSSTDFSSSLQAHDYDAILYGISIGTDPDVFVYWDSSQADIRAASRSNLSEYNSLKADDSLQEGRTRLDPALRVIKYQPFLQAWQQDLPALGLYQPRLLYLTNGPVFGLSDNTINSNIDRFNNVVNWEINEARVTDN